jgi:hypothetical protein
VRVSPRLQMASALSSSRFCFNPHRAGGDLLAALQPWTALHASDSRAFAAFAAAAAGKGCGIAVSKFAREQVRDSCSLCPPGLICSARSKATVLPLPPGRRCRRYPRVDISPFLADKSDELRRYITKSLDHVAEEESAAANTAYVLPNHSSSSASVPSVSGGSFSGCPYSSRPGSRTMIQKNRSMHIGVVAYKST